MLGREVISSRIMEIVFLEAQGWGVVGPVDLDAPEKRATVLALLLLFAFIVTKHIQLPTHAFSHSVEVFYEIVQGKMQ